MNAYIGFEGARSCHMLLSNIQKYIHARGYAHPDSLWQNRVNIAKFALYVFDAYSYMSLHFKFHQIFGSTYLYHICIFVWKAVGLSGNLPYQYGGTCQKGPIEIRCWQVLAASVLERPGSNMYRHTHIWITDCRST